MKYRIKKPEVEQAVRGLFKTQEDFEAKLNLECEKQKHSVYRIFSIAIEPYLCVLNSDSVVSILKSDVEEVVEYDPKKWNPYPKVKPPKKGWYRVQYKYCPGGAGKKNAWYHLGPEAHKNDFWTAEYWEHKDHSGIVFKPWDDEE